jgi:hypothetical protein
LCGQHHDGKQEYASIQKCECVNVFAPFWVDEFPVVDCDKFEVGVIACNMATRTKESGVKPAVQLQGHCAFANSVVTSCCAFPGMSMVYECLLYSFRAFQEYDKVHKES